MRYDAILVNPRFFSLYETKFPPFGAMFLSHSLKKAGYSIKIHDAQIDSDRDLYKLIVKHKPLWVGFGVMTGPTITNTLDHCKIIKRISPNTKIICGGPHPSLLPENMLGHPLIDYIVIGEGDKTIVELSDAIKNGKDLNKVHGIGFKKDGRQVITKSREIITNWDDEVGLDWEGVKIRNYINKIGNQKHIELITSRGCPFRCRFCWNLKANKRRWRAWSAERVIEEVKKMLPYGIDYISFVDDNFGVDLNRAKEIIIFLKKHNITWAFEGFRVGMKLTPELMKFFKDNGCHHLYFGAECGTQKMLDYISKDIKIEDLIESARLCGRYRIGAKYSWVVGFPKETQKDRMKLLDLIDRIVKLNPRCANYIGIFSPYPGSELYEETIQAGWVPPRRVRDWAIFREEINLPYVKDMWYLRSISLTCFFLFAMDNEVRSHSKSKLIYRIPFKILKLTAWIRWKLRFFKFPLEYRLMVWIKELYNHK